MLQTALRNSKGVSLVEMMIAMTVLLFVFLALMQVALVSIDANMKNVIRDEAVNIAELSMADLKSLPFATSPQLDDTGGAFVAESTVVRNFRNVFEKPFTVTKRIDEASSNNKVIDIRVDWDWKGEPFFHQITSIKRLE